MTSQFSGRGRERDRGRVREIETDRHTDKIYRLDRNGKPLIDTMVKTICDCCAIESEKVQLQIVKAILTLGTSPSCEVHGQSLLMCLRACYNIFLSTKNIDVQTSAKAVLTQIVCAVFQKIMTNERISQK